ncbi:MtrB/PioB family decaheme-associated outer membrane protein [Ferrimonas pelagia]|uniref:MtrB/PioB family decaheme-associated outer membrane protein n=1 Tax=Ferrimonas pelagia TaxID=1177826 RepID=A0ABP9EK74_9GAMM
MKPTTPQWIGAFSLMLIPTTWALDFSLQQANTESVKWDAWECKQCKPEQGLSGHFQTGVVNAELSDPHAANALGTDSDGLSLALGADLNYWGNDDTQWQLSANDLGLDIAQFMARANRAGDFQAELRYRALAKWDATIQTPFRLQGNAFYLPTDWQRAATTGQMTGLSAALHPAELAIKRDHLSLSVDKYFDQIRTYAGLSQQERSGRKRTSSSLLTNSVALPEQIDDRTLSVNTGLNVTGGPWQVAFGYIGSHYRNDADAMTWQNPYTATFGSALMARQSVMPDNTAHQFQGQASWLQGRHAISGQLVWGRHQQDALFIPATINGPSPALPAADADLKLDKIDATLRYRLHLSRKASLQAQYQYQDRDYRNPQRFYPQIITDSAVSADRQPLYPDHTQQQAGLMLNYRFTSGFSSEIGYRFRNDQWDNQRFDSADTHRYWAKLRLNRWQPLRMWFEIAQEQREADDLVSAADANGTSDTALRQYHQADRDRIDSKLVVQYQPLPALSFNLTLNGSEDDYDDGQIGLDEVRRYGYDLQTSWYQDNYHLYAFYSNYDIKTQINGSNLTSQWRALQDDEAESLGIGGEYTGLFEALTLGMDLVYADSDALTRIEQGLSGNYGDNASRRTTLDLYGRYQLNEQSSVQLDLLLQKYRDSDYLYSGFQADTITNVLFFPDLSHDYSDYRLGVSYRHDF